MSYIGIIYDCFVKPIIGFLGSCLCDAASAATLSARPSKGDDLALIYDDAIALTRTFTYRPDASEDQVGGVWAFVMTHSWGAITEASYRSQAAVQFGRMP